MPALIATRGLPASGKSTYARVWVDSDRAHRAQVERDQLRLMIDGGVWIDGVTERRIVIARDALILELLTRGLDVVCSDTNLPQRTVRDLAKLAARARAGFEVVDFTDVPLDECVARDARRSDKKPVGESVIRDMHTRFLRGRKLPLPVPEWDGDLLPLGDLYVPPAAPHAILVDVNGTVALRGDRGPFDETRVHDDRPNTPVIEAIRGESRCGYRVVFVSGRTDACRTATVDWLEKHVGVPIEGLFMRPAGDGRKDYVVKRELFDRYVRDHWNIRRVYDDRLQVIRMWRALGLTVLDVAGGEF